MSEATLTIRGGGRSWQVQLDPNGTLIGRSAACDVVIECGDVSRRHARIFRDPSGAWRIEDLGSSNGTFLNGERVASRTLSAGDVVEVGSASLSLGSTRGHPIETPASQAAKIIIEDFGTEVFYETPRLADCTATPCPERLEQVGQRLAPLTDRARLYAEVCRLLAREPKTAAAVFRMPAAGPPTLETPEVLACHFGAGPDDTMAPASHHPSHRAFRVSHRLLEAVREKALPLMSKSIFTCDTQVTLSLIDELSPRALMCAPLGSIDQAVDVLYVDMPIDERVGPGPEEMFAFVQAVTEQVQRAMA